MSYALPHPTRSLAVPLAALALGVAGGTSAALIIAEGDTITRSSAVEVRALPVGGTPVPERVAPGPVSLAPRRAPTSSLAGTSSSSAPAPERISGARTR